MIEKSGIILFQIKIKRRSHLSFEKVASPNTFLLQLASGGDSLLNFLANMSRSLSPVSWPFLSHGFFRLFELILKWLDEFLRVPPCNQYCHNVNGNCEDDTQYEISGNISENCAHHQKQDDVAHARKSNAYDGPFL